MVNPIRGRSPGFLKSAPKKKVVKEVDVRVKKAAGKSKLAPPVKASSSVHASKKIPTEEAYATAQRASAMARQRAFQTKKAAVEAQKKAFLAQRAHMAQQAAAARRARAAEKAKKAAEKAAKKAASLRRAVKFKACLAKPTQKNRSGLLKKYLPAFKKKKSSSPK